MDIPQGGSSGKAIEILKLKLVYFWDYMKVLSKFNGETHMSL